MKVKDKSKLSLFINNITYSNFLDRLSLLAMSMFEWEGLPDGMNARFLEKCLFEYGVACMVYDEKLGYINTKCTPSGELNIYDEPVTYTAYGINYSHIYKAADCIPVRNNLLMKPAYPVLEQYAYRLYQVERTIDVNIHAQRTPLVILCNEKQRLTFQNLYMQYEGNEPLVWGDKTMDMESIKVLKTDAPFLADKLIAYKHNLWNEAMGFLGIKNANIDKKERLITDEVNSNQEQTGMSAQAGLMTRMEAAEAFNKMYGQNVTVKLRDLSFTFDTGKGKA